MARKKGRGRHQQKPVLNKGQQPKWSAACGQNLIKKHHMINWRKRSWMAHPKIPLPGASEDNSVGEVG
eukprot:7790500-Prorocentrum_lima.AAC.1